MRSVKVNLSIDGNETITLMSETRRLLRIRPRDMTLQEISEATGLTYSWLANLSASPERCTEYTGWRLQKLYEFLSGKPLIGFVSSEKN